MLEAGTAVIFFSLWQGGTWASGGGKISFWAKYEPERRHAMKPFEMIQNMTVGKWAALVKICGGPDRAQDILAGEVTVRLKEAVKNFFDRHGRRIPPSGLQSPVVDANRDFHLSQPSLDYGRLIVRATELLQLGPIMSGAEFEARAKAILGQVKADPQLANLLKGVHLPIVLPQMAVPDYGQVLKDIFLIAVEKANTAAFPGRPFNNYRKGDLVGKVTIMPNTRHEQLLAKMSQGAVVGIYFPTALQGFSVPAARAQMTSLPDHVILSGGLDIAMAMVMYPEVLAKDFKTPGLDIATLQWSSAVFSLCFWVRDGALHFGHGYLVARGSFSGGLLLLG